MAKPSKKINMEWSPALAYVIGIIAADGNLSPSGRHINITSKDKEIIENCRAALEIDNKIGKKGRGGSKEKKYFVLQFGSVVFYRFLLNIGLHPAKSKTLGPIKIPEQYFADFLRGCIDGDGSIVTFSHPESQYEQLRLRLASASNDFLLWMKSRIHKLIKVDGGWIEEKYKNGKINVEVLVYANSDSRKILEYMYNGDCQYKLNRKYNFAEKFINLTK